MRSQYDFILNGQEDTNHKSKQFKQKSPKAYAEYIAELHQQQASCHP